MGREWVSNEEEKAMGETSDLLLMIFVWVVGWLCFFGKIHYNAYCRFAHFMACMLHCKKGVKQNKTDLLFFLPRMEAYIWDSLLYY